MGDMRHWFAASVASLAVAVAAENVSAQSPPGGPGGTLDALATARTSPLLRAAYDLYLDGHGGLIGLAVSTSVARNSPLTSVAAAVCERDVGDLAFTTPSDTKSITRSCAFRRRPLVALPFAYTPGSPAKPVTLLVKARSLRREGVRYFVRWITVRQAAVARKAGFRVLDAEARRSARAALESALKRIPVEK